MTPNFSFCESVHATSRTPWHIRCLTEVGKKLGGNIDTPSLCGLVVPPSCWDLEVPFNPPQLGQTWHCKVCIDQYFDYVQVGYFSRTHDGRVYARMANTAALKRVLTSERTKNVQCRVQPPKPPATFYLIDLEWSQETAVSRKLARESLHLEIEERLLVPSLLDALKERSSGASPSTGTSTAPPIRALGRRTKRGTSR